MEQALRVPHKLTTVEPAHFAEAPFDKVNDGSTEDYGVTAAAAALSPAVSEESRDPKRQEDEPDGGAGHKIVEAILAGVDISGVVRSVVGVVRVGVRGQ